MALQTLQVASYQSLYTLSNLYPSGIPNSITIVYFVKDPRNLLPLGSPAERFDCHFADTSVSPRTILGGGAAEAAFGGDTVLGTSFLQNGGGGISGEVRTQDPRNYTAYTQVAIEFSADGQNPLGYRKVRWHDVLGVEVYPEYFQNFGTLFSLKANLKDFQILDNDITNDAIGFANSNPAQSQQFLLGNVAIFEGLLTDAELTEIAREKNITEPKYQTGGRTCAHYWSFIDDWGAGDIPDLGTNPVAITRPFPNSWTYNAENPTTPIKVESIERTGFGNDFFIGSSLAGTIYCIRQTAGSTPPANAAAIINATVGGDILEVLNVTATVGLNAGDKLSFVTGASFTEYDYYHALDSDSGQEVLGAAVDTVTTCGFVSTAAEPIADFDGILFTGAGLNVAWYDSGAPAAFGDVKYTAPNDSADSNGVLVISLPNSTLNQGETGTLLIKELATGKTGHWPLEVQ